MPCTPLHAAAAGGHAACVALLLEHGASVNARPDGATALHTAADAGLASTVGHRYSFARPDPEGNL